MARKASSKPSSSKDSTATIGFEAKLWLTADTAMRDSAMLPREAILRSLSEAKDNLRNNMDAAEPSGARQTAPGSPKGERGGANQYSRAERDRSPKATRRVGAEAPINHVVLGLIFLSRAERDRSPKVTRRASRGLRVKYISDTAGKFRMPNGEIRTRNARPLRHSKFVIRHLPPPADARWSHLQANAKQPTVGMSNAEVRMTNRSCFTSTFENRQSKFA